MKGCGSLFRQYYHQVITSSYKTYLDWPSTEITVKDHALISREIIRVLEILLFVIGCLEGEEDATIMNIMIETKTKKIFAMLETIYNSELRNIS